MKVLNKHAPQKETFAKGNQMSFLMKDFQRNNENTAKKIFEK